MDKKPLKQGSTPVETYKKINPQQALERILAAEIRAAERISAAHEKAEKAVSAARSGMEKIKSEILADARQKRETSFTDGIKTAREAAEKMLSASRANTAEFTSRASQFVDGAVEDVIAVLLGLEGKEE